MSTDERSTWADLAPELLELIFQRLTLVDYFKCREICSCWRKAVNDALATKGRCPPLSQLTSLLIAPDNNTNPFKLVSLTQHGSSVLTMSTQSYADDLVDHFLDKVHSVQGWLMFNRIHYDSERDQTFSELSFLNPVSLVRFKLPILSLFSGGPGRYYRGSNSQIAFASAPCSQEFLVVYLIHHFDIHQDMQKQRLAFCKVTHKSWTTIETVETQTTIIRSIAIHDVKLYATTWEITGSMLIFNLGDGDAKATTVERLVILHPKLPPRNFEGFRHRLAMDTTRGELLLVYQFIAKANGTDEEPDTVVTTRFRVFKLDLGGGPRWSEIEDLGDRFLFVDWAGVGVVYARDLDGAQEFNGGNCIFFCDADPLSRVARFPRYDVGVFSLADKSIKRLPGCSSLPPSSVCLPATWFSPSPW